MLSCQIIGLPNISCLPSYPGRRLKNRISASINKYVPKAVNLITYLPERAIFKIVNLIDNPVLTGLLSSKKYYTSPYATKDENSLGRIIPELEDARSSYSRDKDRILHTRALEASAGKTQVVVDPESPHIHNRRFHTDKVVSVARDIGRRLGLNENLIEAIALGHDLGHTPFSHTGEKELLKFSMRDLGKPFKHHLHSLKIVDILEHKNLTYEVRDGIAHHCGERLDEVLKPRAKPSCLEPIDDEGFPCTLEGCVVRLADQIAYFAHDYNDSLRLGIIASSDLPEIVKRKMGTTFGSMLKAMIRDVVKESKGKNYITMSKEFLEARAAFYNFEYKQIIESDRIKKRREKVPDIIKTLYDFYTQKKKFDPQTAIDKIASYTDKQARSKYNAIKKIFSEEKLRLINDFRDAMDKASDLAELYKIVMDELPNQFKQDGVQPEIRSQSIMLYDEEKEGLVFADSRGIRKETEIQTIIEPDEQISGEVFASGEPLLVEDTILNGVPLDLKRKTERGSFMSVRIETKKGESLGVISIRSNQPNDFKNEDLDHLRKLASILAHEISIRRPGVLDGMTGLYSKEPAGMRRLNKMFNEAKTQNIPLTLIMFDIDHFKDTNDNFGHLTGDKIIKAITRTARKIFKKKRTSLIEKIGIRYGGEEFLLAFLGIDKELGRQIAEELRRETGILQFNFLNQKTNVLESFNETVSLGVAELRPEQTSVEDLIADTDRALYQSKNTGRNRVTVFDENKKEER